MRFAALVDNSLITLPSFAELSENLAISKRLHEQRSHATIPQRSEESRREE